MANFKDPLKVLKEARKEAGEPLASELALPLAPHKQLSNPTSYELTGPHPADQKLPGLTFMERVKGDFRVFLTLVWRHLLGNDPNPIQLDMAYWLQHGPSRSIIMAFRGFSKSWITGAYALWRLLRDPNEKVMVVSGSLMRAQATSNWCLSLIMTMDILAELRPKANNRQSATMFDVGNCVPAQSASFTAFGIGGQLVGFRGSLIIPDDVETQTNSLTVVMREKIREAVKEFESVLVPGGEIKYLGTPHDAESLYLHLLALKNDDGSPVYQARIWTALYPSEEERKVYKGMLAPYIDAQIRKLGPTCIGKSTMPMRFTDEDLAQRRAAMGLSEFRLQFMLNMALNDSDKYPLKLRDLIVMDLEDKRGPEELAWGTTHRDLDLPLTGFDGDFYHQPVYVGDHFAPYDLTIGFVDPSGRGANETAMIVLSLLNGRVFLQRVYATRKGYEDSTLDTIGSLCVRYRISELFIEGNFGDGMFLKLVSPAVHKAWARWNENHKTSEHGGTTITEVKSGNQFKEQRILSVLEPVTQGHRLVVNREVINSDLRSLEDVDGEENRKYYSLFYQFTHLTKEKDSLREDDRLEALACAIGMLAEKLGIDPVGMARQRRQEREEDILEQILREHDEAVMRGSEGQRKDTRVNAARIQQR
jgi:hypothetical protein